MKRNNILILCINGKELLGSDGLLYFDRRLSLKSIKNKVIHRNKLFQKNFPHKIVDSFKFWGNPNKIYYL
jgi:hypothetical protein